MAFLASHHAITIRGTTTTLALLAGVVLAGAGCDKKDQTKASGPGSPPATATERGGPPGGAAGGMGMRQDLSSPQATIQTLARALDLGDVAVAREAATPESQGAVEALVGFVVSMRKLDQAAVEKFGPTGRISEPGQGMTDYIDALRNAEVTADGDTATARPRGPQVRAVPLRKVNGQWQADARAVLDVPPGKTLEEYLPALRSMGNAAEQTARDVAAGKFNSAQDAKQAFGRQFMAAALPAVMSVQQGQGGTTQGAATQPAGGAQ